MCPLAGSPSPSLSLPSVRPCSDHLSLMKPIANNNPNAATPHVRMTQNSFVYAHTQSLGTWMNETQTQPAKSPWIDGGKISIKCIMISQCVKGPRQKKCQGALSPQQKVIRDFQSRWNAHGSKGLLCQHLGGEGRNIKSSRLALATEFKASLSTWDPVSKKRMFLTTAAKRSPEVQGHHGLHSEL